MWNGPFAYGHATPTKIRATSHLEGYPESACDLSVSREALDGGRVGRVDPGIGFIPRGPPGRRERRDADDTPRRSRGGTGDRGEAPGPDPRLRRPCGLHGERCGDRPGGARILRKGNQGPPGRPRTHSIPDAPPPHDTVRDGRIQVSHPTSHLRRAAVRTAPNRLSE